MPVSIIQSGSSLQLVSTAGAPTTLTLPTGVTLRTDVPPRWCAYQGYLVLVNTPSQPLTIDSSGTVRLLTPKPPRLAPVLTGPNAGSLTGTYRSKMTFVIQDTFGNVISESDYGPFSAAVTIAAKKLLASNLDISPDTISGRRLYRTADNGSEYFQWVDLDGNVLTSVQDDLSDAGLSLTSGPVLGTPPRLTMCAEFRGRLFGMGDIDINNLRYTEAGVMYAWPEDNEVPIPSIGSDQFGVVAMLPLRDALGVGRRNMLVQVIGTGIESNDDIDLDVVILSKELGVESQESVVIYRDTAYFLWKDGVYSWNSDGIRCVSNGNGDKGNVRSWFTTDSYFNRDLFTTAFAHIDPDRPVYRLFLCSAGSSTIDRWIEYDIDNQTWWGPHSTSLFTPASAFNRLDAFDKNIAIVGGPTHMYQGQSTRTDGTGTAITFDAVGKRHDMKVPDQEKYFGEISMLGKAQSAGVLSVVSRVGALNTTQSLTQYYDMTTNRKRMGRLGQGLHAQLEFLNAEVGVDVELYGYEVDPVHIVGRH